METAPWILEGRSVSLVPLSRDHYPKLCEIGLDERLWRLTRIQVQTAPDMLEYIDTALREQAGGTALPLVIIEKASGNLVGTSRYHNISPEHRRLEIGFSFIAHAWQRRGINAEAKYLMLKHAFEEMRYLRVEFKVDSSNTASQASLRSIGAKKEGTLRNFAKSKHKGQRDMVVYSIIDSEWPVVKARLEEKIEHRVRQADLQVTT
jgi:N-acetyltransferase